MPASILFGARDIRQSHPDMSEVPGLRLILFWALVRGLSCVDVPAGSLWCVGVNEEEGLDFQCGGNTEVENARQAPFRRQRHPTAPPRHVRGTVHPTPYTERGGLLGSMH